jgi:hypothetical protein
MSKIKADLIINVHVTEKKMENKITVIREELETQICDFCASQAELEERFDKQQESVASMVEPQNCGRNWRAPGEDSSPS